MTVRLALLVPRLVLNRGSRATPGGLLAATNVEDCKPFRHMLEFVLDWHLIYRGLKRSAALLPQSVPAGQARLIKDPTEVNVFVEVRRPEHG